MAPRKQKQSVATITAKDPVLFYGAANPDGYLLQMYVSAFTHCNKMYNCSEHFFQYAKAALFKDERSMSAIMKASDPKRQKALRKKVTPFDAEKWDSEAYKVVVKATHLKFTVSEHATILRDKLEATGNRVLAEASPGDTIWGIRLGLEAAKVHRGPWPGKNLLGGAIMQVRTILRAERERQAKAAEAAAAANDALDAEADAIIAEAKEKTVGNESEENAELNDQDAEGEVVSNGEWASSFA